MRAGSRTFWISRQRLAMKLLSIMTTVSTSTVTRSPGDTFFWPLFLASIFSAIVIPISCPVVSAARIAALQRVELRHAHEVVQFLERHLEVGALDEAMLLHHFVLEHRHGVHHAPQRRGREQA